MMQAVRGGETILVVEDDPLVASHIAEVLLDLEFCVAGCASTGSEAIAISAQERPTLALVDIRLSGPMDGIEVAQVLRHRFGISSIFLSGQRDERTVARAREAGSLGFLQKPFRPSQAYAAIDRALLVMASSDREERDKIDPFCL
jgi:DNA-binding response OmpR family regulator